MLSTAGRILFGYRPILPWISYRAIKHLDKLIQPDWKVLEFGSGMSTRWLAPRCKTLVSIESNAGWHSHVTTILKSSGISNVEYHFADESAYHAGVLEKFPDGFFDFALVDGYNRAGCMKTSLRKVRKGGWVYLDNSDKIEGKPLGTQDIQNAEKLLIEHQKKTGGKPKYFCDLMPCYALVTEGVLGQV